MEKLNLSKSLLVVACLFVMLSGVVYGEGVSLVGEEAQVPVESTEAASNTSSTIAPSAATATNLSPTSEPTGLASVPERDNKMSVDIKPTHQDKKIDWVKLIDPGTAEILGVFDMFTTQNHDFLRTEDDGSGIHCLLEGEGDERRVLVRSPYANRPLVQILYADGTSEQMRAPEPQSVGGSDEKLRYLGDVGLRIFVPEGGLGDYFDKIDKPLDAKYGDQNVNLRNFQKVGDGYYVHLDVHTDEAVDEVTSLLPPAVKGESDGRGALFQY